MKNTCSGTIFLLKKKQKISDATKSFTTPLDCLLSPHIYVFHMHIFRGFELTILF